jgi:IS30 family transposase
MKPRYRRGFSLTEKTELWDRWKRGESLRSIGRVFGKPSSSIYFQLAPYGGIRPARRCRSRLALTLSEREEISRGIVAQRYLRSKRTIRRSKQATQKGGDHGQIKDMISIRERPASVEDRAVPGHWEGDLITGSKSSHIATLVERHSRYVMLLKVPDKRAETFVSALIRQAKTLPDEPYKSLTWDRGKELAAHKQFTLATDIDLYFCDPQSPWQRGSNENTNGLLR